MLVEALACGTPVVATDCPGGPAEILAGGRYGKLVPVGNPSVMAQAILETLHDRPDAALLQRRAEDFAAARIVNQYRELLLGDAR